MVEGMAFVHEADMLKGSPLAGWSGRFFHSDNMTFARWTIGADAQDLHEHQHPYEEVWNIVGGQITLIVDGVEEKLVAGAAAIVPPSTPHAVRVIGAAEVVVTDFPVRHDLPGVSR
jgi:mannose-6-phosphate isomerase-like protein (cupin superfamily)